MPRETWRPRSHVLVNFGTTSILWHHHVLLAHVGNAEWIVADTDRKLTVLKLESPPLLGIVDYNRSQAELPVGIIRAESIMEDESTKGIFETKELLRLCQRAEERVPYERARLGYVDLKIGHFRALGANKKEQIHFGDALVVTPSDQEFGRHCTVQVGEYGATMAGEYVEDVQFDKWLYNHVPLSDDVRVLPVAFDTMGQRYCKMETSSARQTTDKFKDWPLEGDRFAQAHCRLVYLKHRTYANFHENWARSLLYDDPANDDVPEHKILCSAMHDFVTYDQLNIGNLAGVERIVKRLMEIEGMEGEYEREVGEIEAGPFAPPPSPAGAGDDEILANQMSAQYEEFERKAMGQNDPYIFRQFQAEMERARAEVERLRAEMRRQMIGDEEEEVSEPEAPSAAESSSEASSSEESSGDGQNDRASIFTDVGSSSS